MSENILEVSNHSVKLLPKEIKRFEREIKARIPKDLKWFWLNFGSGTINEELKILSPREVLEQLNDFNPIHQAGQWDWKKIDEVPRDENILITILDSDCNDRICYLKKQPNERWFFFPRHGDEIERVPNSVKGCLFWLLDRYGFEPPAPKLFFRPRGVRRRRYDFNQDNVCKERKLKLLSFLSEIPGIEHIRVADHFIKRDWGMYIKLIYDDFALSMFISIEVDCENRGKVEDKLVIGLETMGYKCFKNGGLSI